MNAFPKQLFRHRPDEGVFGDCHRTVIAALLGKQPADVPHFAEDDADAVTFHNRKRAFLAQIGLVEFTVAYDASLDLVLEAMGSQNSRCLYILGGMSRTGCNHSVLCRGGSIIHDPSLDDAGIVGPMDDGYYRVSVLALQPEVPA